MSNNDVVRRTERGLHGTVLEPDAADHSPDAGKMAAGEMLPPMPTTEEAEAVWREAFAARLVQRGVLNQEEADACAAAGDVDLSCDPGDAADDEISYWDADE